MRPLRFLLVVPLLLALATAALAELSISGETKIAEYTFVKLQAKGAAEGSGYIWAVFDSTGKKVPAKSLWKQKDRLVFVGPQGTYSVTLTAFRFDPKTGETDIEEAEAEVVEALGVAVMMNGGPGTVWAPRALAAFRELAGPPES